MRAPNFLIALLVQAQMAEAFRVTITYPAPQKANPYPKPTLAPTPKLRAQAAVGEAVGSFKSMARSGGMIAISLSMSMISFESLSVLEQYFWLMPLSLLPVSLSLSFAAVDFTPASKRAKYFERDRRRPERP